MCQKCVDAVKRYFPELPQTQYGDLLMGATAFPFGCPESVERQLKAMAEDGIQTLDMAFGYAQRKMDEAMANRNTSRSD